MFRHPSSGVWSPARFDIQDAVPMQTRLSVLPSCGDREIDACFALAPPNSGFLHAAATKHLFHDDVLERCASLWREAPAVENELPPHPS